MNNITTSKQSITIRLTGELRKLVRKRKLLRAPAGAIDDVPVAARFGFVGCLQAACRPWPGLANDFLVRQLDGESAGLHTHQSGN